MRLSHDSQERSIDISMPCGVLQSYSRFAILHHFWRHDVHHDRCVYVRVCTVLVFALWMENGACAHYDQFLKMFLKNENTMLQHKHNEYRCRRHTPCTFMTFLYMCTACTHRMS